MDTIGNMYCWFNSLFGESLEKYLWGWDCETEAFTNANLFNTIGYWTIGIAFVIAFIYYYVINHPRFNRWWNWIIMLVVAMVINFLMAYLWTSSDLANGYIGECLLTNENSIYANDCMGFGIANALITVLPYCIFSLSFKYGSKNCKSSPF